MAKHGVKETSKLSDLKSELGFLPTGYYIDVRSFGDCFIGLTVTLFALNVAQSTAAERHSMPLPRFEDYHVKAIFNRTPHPPIFETPEQRHYRTRIREGVEKGWGVAINGEWGTEQNRPGPNFAGHYVVIAWGCGAPCLMMAVCDLETRAVYNPPLSANGLALPLLVFENSPGSDAEIEYRRDSKLMIIKATPRYWERSAKSYAFYFVLQNTQWKLLRRMPITEER